MRARTTAAPTAAGTRNVPLARLPAVTFFPVSAVFHYLGPALAVLLFRHLDVLGVAWLRIAAAAAIFAVWRRPWRLVRQLDPAQRAVMLAMGGVLASMNALFYLAVDRLPLSTVAAIEFLGTIVLAALGVRTWRNALALVTAAAGVLVLTDIRLLDAPLGFVFAFANCGLFMLYVALGHRIANDATAGSSGWTGIDQLGAAMLVAAVLISPVGLGGALPAFGHPGWLLAGIGVGVCSSVIPYVADQLAMARLHRATFALLLAILPLTATVIGLVVLAQRPTAADLAGVGLVMAGVLAHQPPSAVRRPGPPTAVRPRTGKRRNPAGRAVTLPKPNDERS